MTTLYLDAETYSEVPLNYGAHAYAEKAEVMLLAYAIDDAPVEVIDLTRGDQVSDIWSRLPDEPYTIVMHNGGMFDSVVLRHALGIDLPPERIHDTLVQALAHGLPGALGKLCEILGVPIDKAKAVGGRQLINLFCKPSPKNSKIRRATRDTHPAEWQKFIEYARLDIEAVRAVYARLPRWNYPNHEHGLWCLDQHINNRGCAVDRDLARAAIHAVAVEQGRLSARTVDLTAGAVGSTTQRDALLKHILEAHGVSLPDMQADTLERRLNDPELPIEVRELIAIRLEASTTSTAKYGKLMNAVSSDGRMRGTMQFCGAARTGRWSHKLFQPGNMPRPAHSQDEIDLGIEALKAGCADLVIPDVMKLASSAIRGCIVAPPGKKLVISDLANIEGRDAAWLAGEEWKLEAFRAFDAGTGPDLYKLAYAKAFNVSPDDVGKGTKRQIGKVMELMLQYEGGVGAFLTGAATYGIDLEEMAEAAWDSIPNNILKEAMRAYEWAVKNKRAYGLDHDTYVVCDSLKRMWRNAHPAISSYWKELENAAIQAICTPGKTIECRKLKLRRDGAWLRIVLPSGRALCYASPRVEDGKISYMGLNPYSRQWSRLKTYGGKLFENVCQAVARDVMAANMSLIETHGYEIILSVHDELITEAPDGSLRNPIELSRCLANNPLWAPDMPLAAGGFEAYRYRKD